MKNQIRTDDVFAAALGNMNRQSKMAFMLQKSFRFSEFGITNAYLLKAKFIRPLFNRLRERSKIGILFHVPNNTLNRAS